MARYSPLPATQNPPVRLRTSFPLYLRWSTFYKLDGTRIIKIVHVWTTMRQWERQAISYTPGWGTKQVGWFVVATRLEP